MKAGGLFLPAAFVNGQAFSFRDTAWISSQSGSTGNNAVFADVAGVWHFDNVLTGTVGGQDFTDNGSAGGSHWTFGTGIHNQDWSMNSINTPNAIQTVDSALVRAGSGISFTFTVWIKPHVTTEVNNPFLAKWSAANAEYAALIINGTGLQWYCQNLANSANAHITLAQPSNNAWHFVVMGYDDSSQLMFAQIDNGARSTTAIVGVRNFTNALALGNYSDGPALSSVNELDELYLWKRALSTTEATTLWNASSGLFYSP